MSGEENNVQLKVDVGILKNKVDMITQLCDKMDTVIEKLMDNQDRIAEQIYTEMEKREQETTTDIKELHSRITTVDRNLSDKLELTERRIMEEIKDLKKQLTESAAKEDTKIDKILEWKWMAAGGIVVIAWLLSNIKFDTIIKIISSASGAH